MVSKLLSAVQKQRRERQRTNDYRNLLRSAAVIGGKLFGPVPAGHRREFFCLDKNTWIWHEEWLDALGERRVLTTRYDVRPDVILKTIDGSSYRSISVNEKKHLIMAAKSYYQAIYTQFSGANAK